MKKICIINGVNLSLVGQREKEIYGSYDIVDADKTLTTLFPNIQLTFIYENIEGAIAKQLHQLKDYDGIVINPGAYTHTSLAIADAVRAIDVPTVEVHISQVMAREPYRRRSYIAEVCVASISGMGAKGYEMAIRYLIDKF